MKEYIKKFDSLAAADGHVIDNPFTSTIVTQGGGAINLTCNQPDKKLKLEGGSIVIVDNVTLISFNMYSESMYLLKTFLAEEGMTWEEWCSSKYNNDELRHYIISGDYVVWDDNGERVKRMTGSSDPQYAWTDVLKTDEIINNSAYKHSTIG